MNEKMEKELMEKASMMGYKNLVEAICNCDKEVQEKIIDEYNNVISSSDLSNL